VALPPQATAGRKAMEIVSSQSFMYLLY